MAEDKSYFKYWGKADRNDPNRYHLLVYHCLDVAAVGWFLLDPKKILCRRLASQLKVEPIWLRDFFVFCLALHDLGKFSRAFQGLQPNLSVDLVKSNPRMPYNERHDSLGFLLWRDNSFRQLFKDLKNHDWLSKIDPWLETVTGHHGIPPKRSRIRVTDFFEKEDEDAAYQFFVTMIELFLPQFDQEPLIDKELKKRLKLASWQLSGITVLADWQGSNREYFKYIEDPISLSLYWHETALPNAQTVIERIPKKPNVRQFEGIQDLFSFIKAPTPLQEYAINEPISHKPQLFILEDVTGAGKTEAALILTHRLFNTGIVDGLYVALPTMATANAMHKRLGKVYRRFYGTNEPPSLMLAHGARELSDDFQETVGLPENQQADHSYSDADEKQMSELSATAFCNAWLADSRKKALLADVGVGTLDQALLAVLPARHQSLRLLGLNRKVLLVDEVHAYDCYMQKLLDALLEAHARQGGSAILLSATLPRTMRENLITAFQRGLEEIPFQIKSNAYPLATHFPVVNDCEKYIDTREEVKRKVIVKRIEKEDQAIDIVRHAANSGQCVCWIRNTVKAARGTHRELAECEWLDNRHLHLFHSRFAMIDRQQIENDAEKMFGQNSTHANRAGQVMVATQVVEQSLDLDFDVLITDLAPIDLVIQRAGRLKRHVRDAQGNRIGKLNAKDQRGDPVLYLYSPDPMGHPEAGWIKKHQKGTQAVYPHIGQLWLTARLLLKDQHGEFTMPDDARNLIEGVYSVDIEDSVPDGLKSDSYTAWGQDQSRKSMADFNALNLNKGYTRLSATGYWDEETRYPTRLTEEESVSVALATWDKEKLIPYAACVHYPWSMSVLKIPEWEWEEAKQQIPAKIREMVEKLKEETKPLRWLEVFPLTEETHSLYNAKDGWQLKTGER